MQQPYFILPNELGCKGKLLDAYLAAGYYRMANMIFTTYATQINDTTEALPVFWLRTPVQNIVLNKAAKLIQKKGSQFTCTYKKANITAEVEALYSLYFKHIHFAAASTCFDCLHQAGFENPFTSWMIEVRENNLLIAVGFFDEGADSIAGILNFYHPNYKKYSLGKYLMLLKIKYALANNILFYYTGYLSTKVDKFDYKLFPDVAAIQVYLPAQNQWQPYSNWNKASLQQYYKQYLS
jgi:arginine-tRNA-protein transferase